MTTYGCVLVSRNDDYGGYLKERATYSLNSCISSYDSVIYVDYNSRDKTLFEEIKNDLLITGKLTCIVVPNEFHLEHTKDYLSPQPCSEVLGRNIGIRRLDTDVIISTNIDEINPPRRFIDNFNDKNTMITVARHGLSLEHVKILGSYNEIDKIRKKLLMDNHPQSFPIKMTPYDIWSKVAWCGDLQMAHRDLWYEIKGFEEWQLGPGFHDSYVQRKVMELGKEVTVSYDIPIWHMDHHKSSLYNEISIPNSNEVLFEKYPGILNDNNWGYPDIEFESRVL